MVVRKGKGLSLMEVMIAIAILAIATLALISVRTYSLKGQQKTQERQVATSLAASIMSEVEGAVGRNFNIDLPNEYAADTAGWPDGFSYELVQDFESSNLQRVEVVIRWQDQNGDQEFRLWTKFLSD